MKKNTTVRCGESCPGWLSVCSWALTPFGSEALSLVRYERRYCDVNACHRSMTRLDTGQRQKMHNCVQMKLYPSLSASFCLD